MKRGTYAVTVLLSVDDKFGMGVADMVAFQLDGMNMTLLTAPVVTELYEPVEVPA